MECPKCHGRNTKVIDSRPVEGNTAIRRRRKCSDCDYRFTTFERVEKTPLLVIKKDGTREEFSRDKLLRGLVRSAEKRPVPLATLEKVVTDIESKIHEKGKKEVASKEIGEMVMEILPQIDEVSYIRYASVYREFKDPSVFVDEIADLKKKQQNNVYGQTKLDLDFDDDQDKD